MALIDKVDLEKRSEILRAVIEQIVREYKKPGWRIESIDPNNPDAGHDLFSALFEASKIVDIWLSEE